MCYNKSYLTKRLEKYARRYGDNEEEVKYIREQLEKFNIAPVYQVSGFDHPSVPVILDDTKQIHLFTWGLIPHWIESPVEAVKISNTTINARAESMFEKPAFREAARNRRCLVLVDGFFEHHHKLKQAYPYYIFLKDDEPMTLAGLWDEWKDPVSGIVRRTYSVVTTQANSTLARIHNNPKLEDGPRMPLILSREHEHDWLKPIHEKADQELIQMLAKPFDEAAINYYTVKKLKGKESVGNKPEAIIPFRYPELEAQQGSLF
jgi:putative SOS response-associated peptidase YedK